MSQRAVFLDRDGTLIEHYDYLTDESQVKLMPRVAHALRLLRDHGFKLVVITNQSAVARGMITEKKLAVIHARLEALLTEQGAYLDAIYYCPFHPEGVVDKYRKESDMRKPAPGMLKLAAEALQLDLKQSWMVGDDDRDIKAGNAAGCRTILLQHRGSALVQRGSGGEDFKALNLQEAANLIIHHKDDAVCADVGSGNDEIDVSSNIGNSGDSAGRGGGGLDDGDANGEGSGNNDTGNDFGVGSNYGELGSNIDSSNIDIDAGDDAAIDTEVNTSIDTGGNVISTSATIAQFVEQSDERVGVELDKEVDTQSDGQVGVQSGFRESLISDEPLLRDGGEYQQEDKLSVVDDDKERKRREAIERERQKRSQSLYHKSTRGGDIGDKYKFPVNTDKREKQTEYAGPVLRTVKPKIRRSKQGKESYHGKDSKYGGENVPGDNTIENILMMILQELKSIRRDEETESDFSVFKVLAGVIQMIVVLCLILAYWFGSGREPDDNSVQQSLLAAMVFQMMALTFLIMSKS